MYSKTDFKKTKNIKNEKCGIIRAIIEILKITIRFFMPIHLKTQIKWMIFQKNELPSN